MADLALVSTTALSIVEPMIIFPGVAGATIVGGQLVRQDTATGRFVLAAPDTVANNRVLGMAARSATAGQPLTIIRKGVMDGFVLGALAWDAALWLGTTGNLADATAGATPLVVGRVIAGFYNTSGNAHDKLVFVDL